MISYTTDNYGRVVLNSESLFELWYCGGDHEGAFIEQDSEVISFNDQCHSRNKDDFSLTNPEGSPKTHEQRIEQWTIPDNFKQIDVEEYCLSLCADDVERVRVRHEMVLYRSHEMVPVLQTLIFMIEQFRENKIVWGIGRGSSVASYVLYLIGVHKINSLEFGLDVEDFLR